jgi:protein-S-isoprenylcysteine O-methyltransferase Ste14
MNIRIKVFIVLIVEYILIGLILFLAAGTIDWFAGWFYLILLFIFSVVFVLWLLKYDPELLQERMTIFKPNQATWDKVFIVLLMISYVAWLILMPLDAVRYGWSQMPLWLQVAGTAILLISLYGFYLVYRENPYLSPMVRIQEERGQTVISTGPYRYIRHPLYSFAILFFLGSALLLGSWYGVLSILIFVGLLIGRIIGEERLLRERLKGYNEYMAQVNYRLIPHVW